jgi:hypothetical protein
MNRQKVLHEGILVGLAGAAGRDLVPRPGSDHC